MAWASAVLEKAARACLENRLPSLPRVMAMYAAREWLADLPSYGGPVYANIGFGRGGRPGRRRGRDGQVDGAPSGGAVDTWSADGLPSGEAPSVP
ncbi:MAG: hypothetical protein II518_05510 [Candidatus Methanomethylophilus sp.]|nr:hypothetical protein [Methanomethylophilus sp.]